MPAILHARRAAPSPGLAPLAHRGLRPRRDDLCHVPGRDLSFVLRRHETARGPLPLDLATQIVTRVAAGLAHAHGRRDAQGRSLGIVHRDVSPENVIVTFAGTVKLVDFGIARLFRAQKKGTMIGTLGFAPPEQYQGNVDPRSDIYSLGCVLFECLAGVPPFQDPLEEAVLRMHASRPAPEVRTLRDEVPRSLADAIMRALRKDPAERWPSAAEMGRAGAPHGDEARGALCDAGLPLQLSGSASGLWLAGPRQRDALARTLPRRGDAGIAGDRRKRRRKVIAAGAVEGGPPPAAIVARDSYS